MSISLSHVCRAADVTSALRLCAHRADLSPDDHRSDQFKTNIICSTLICSSVWCPHRTPRPVWCSDPGASSYPMAFSWQRISLSLPVASADAHTANSIGMLFRTGETHPPCRAHGHHVSLIPGIMPPQLLSPRQVTCNVRCYWVLLIRVAPGTFAFYTLCHLVALQIQHQTSANGILTTWPAVVGSRASTAVVSNFLQPCLPIDDIGTGHAAESFPEFKLSDIRITWA